MPDRPIKLFISHASEDKEAFVRRLANGLRENPNFEVWYDEYSLRLGDSLSQSIAKGLGSCDYGIVVLSPDFFSKKWPANEFAGLLSLETKERKILLPIWHNGVTHEQVLEFNPTLADRKAISSSMPVEDIVFAIQVATGVSESTKKIQNPYQSLATEVQNEILERSVNHQLSNSSEGVGRVTSSVAFLCRRFEQLINEIQGLSIQIKHVDDPFSSSYLRTISALGPCNANIEVAYANKGANCTVGDELAVVLFVWEDNPLVVGGKKRRERNRVVYSPSFLANREVVWTLKTDPPRARVIEGVLWLNEGDPSKARVTSEAVAQQAVSSLLQFIRERVQKVDTPGSYLPPTMR